MLDSTVYTTSVIVTCFKLLLIPAYFSTDLEVHRNWLTITHTLDINQWYITNTSQWTLDYPPFFAWYQYLLSHIARLVDNDIILIDNNTSDVCILFQRLTVIICDVILILATHLYCTTLNHNDNQSKLRNDKLILSLFTIGNIGLLMVDHIHFQYNGFLFGIFIISLACMKLKYYILAALSFSILLNFKHIFLYASLPYFLFLIRHYCLTARNSSTVFYRVIALSTIVVAIFTLSFGPFLHQLPFVLARLFPFKRGLTHSYWAPNIWSIYNTMDVIISTISNRNSSSALTRGLIGQNIHQSLPAITPFITLLLTLVSMVPILFISLSKRRIYNNFLLSVTIAAFNVYMLGWHVHEKSILLVVIPLLLLAVEDSRYGHHFILLSITAYYSITPLLYGNRELIITSSLLILHTVSVFQVFDASSITNIEMLYIAGYIILFAYSNIVHYILIPQYRFLPLLLTSLYCSVGTCVVWVRLHIIAIKSMIY